MQLHCKEQCLFVSTSVNLFASLQVPVIFILVCVYVCVVVVVHPEALSVPSEQTAGLCLFFLSQINQTSRRHFLTLP